jgi:glucosamine-6-phosphate deaminase
MRRDPLILADARRVGLVAAELVADRLAAQPAARLLLPTGRTPAEMYAALRARARASGDATVLQLDEYAGVAPDDPRSFAAQLRAALDGIPLRALRTIDGSAPDLAAEAARHAAEVQREPIDLAVLGLGRNGHVAFNEPPARVFSGVRAVTLAASTRTDAAPAFGGLGHVPGRALTVGLGTLLAARELLLLVTGAEKAAALRAMLEDPDTDSPAALLHDHPHLTILCDPPAASLLSVRSLAS